jgi:predicted transcriptional regulator
MDSMIAAKPSRMGRPPLGVRATKVRLTDDQLRRIDQLVGARRMAAWIRDAINRELERQEAERAAHSAAATQRRS